MSEEKKQPVFRGLYKHVDRKGGFAFWLPNDWHRFDMREGYQGVIYSPHPDHFNTSFSAQKMILDYKVAQEDVPTLREGFNAGLMALPGIEIESQDESVTSTLITFEARFTFLEGEARRKRWVRNIYWQEGQLLLIAQGATPEEFDYWLPMFFNTMMTLEL